MTDPQTLGGGRYVLVKRLGEGGMATVWRAFDQRLQVWRAVKVLLPEYSVKPKILARFNAEAQTMALLEHPNIVRVYDVEIPVEGVNENGDPPYIVMELVEGGSLVDWLEANGPMPPRMAVDVVVASCQALEIAHARNVIHRDIKPHNIMVDREGVVRLTDFGIARAADVEGKSNLTRTGAVMGTLGYMAPEQKSDAKHLDARADIYAMAATLYSLLTDKTPMDLFASEKDATLLDGIPDLLAPVLVKATEYRPDLRYASAREFAAALLKVRDELPPDPPGTPPLLRPLDAPPPPPVSKPEATRYATKLTTAPSPPAAAAVAPGNGVTLLPDDTARGPGVLTMPPGEHDHVTPASQDRATWTPAPASHASSGGRSATIAVVVAICALLLTVGVLVLRPSEPVVVTVPAPTVLPAVTPEPVAATAPVPATAPTTTQAPAPAPASTQARPVRRPADGGVTPAPPLPRVDDHLVPEPVAPVVVAPPAPAEVAQCFKKVTVPASAASGASVPFRANMCKDGPVTLNYRAAGGEWFQKSLRLAVGSYSATVQLTPALGDTLEWYLEAGDLSFGSRAAPKTVKVEAVAP